MEDASALIIQALKTVDVIQPGGKASLLAIATRALYPEARLSRDGISEALGLHPSVVVSMLVSADLAGDTDARRDLGLAFFERLQLRTHPPQLTDLGRIAVATWCLEHLMPMKEVLGSALERTLDQTRLVVEGKTPSSGTIQDLQERARKLQTAKVVGVAGGSKGTKEKLGLTEEDQFRRHAAQAIRGMLQGLTEAGQSPHLCTTVAGEVTQALGIGLGLAAAAGFCMDLALHMESLPQELLTPTPQH
jgi:hypothetical protein